MVIIRKLISEAPRMYTAAKGHLDYAYAVATGTAIGIGSNQVISDTYEMWKGKNKSPSWDDKYIH